MLGTSDVVDERIYELMKLILILIVTMSQVGAQFLRNSRSKHIFALLCTGFL